MKAVSNFPERLREALDGMPQNELAEKLGLSKQTVSAYLTGRRSPKKITAKVLADALNVDVAWLMGFDVPKYPLKNAFLYSGAPAAPILGSVRAGNGGLAVQEVLGYAPLMGVTGDSEQYFWLKVSGDSMAPKIEDGDLILIRKQPYIDSGELGVVIVNGDEGVVKRVRSGAGWMELISINPYYPPRRFEGTELEDIIIVGLVKQILRAV